jgi:hypothetical protein
METITIDDTFKGHELVSRQDGYYDFCIWLGRGG